MPRDQPSPVDLLLVPSSDLHVDDENNTTQHNDATSRLAAASLVAVPTRMRIGNKNAMAPTMNASRK